MTSKKKSDVPPWQVCYNKGVRSGPPTMPKLEPLTLLSTPGALKVTQEQWLQYLAPDLEDQRGDLETFGPWSIPVRFKAPAVSVEWGQYSVPLSYTLYGFRTLCELRSSGYQLEGRVSVSGKKRRGFTSSLLCELPDGKLLETATIHVCPHQGLTHETQAA